MAGEIANSTSGISLICLLYYLDVFALICSLFLFYFFILDPKDTENNMVLLCGGRRPSQTTSGQGKTFANIEQYTE